MSLMSKSKNSCLANTEVKENLLRFFRLATKKKYSLKSNIFRILKLRNFFARAIRKHTRLRRKEMHSIRYSVYRNSWFSFDFGETT